MIELFFDFSIMCLSKNYKTCDVNKHKSRWTLQDKFMMIDLQEIFKNSENHIYHQMNF